MLGVAGSNSLLSSFSCTNNFSFLVSSLTSQSPVGRGKEFLKLAKNKAALEGFFFLLAIHDEFTTVCFSDMTGCCSMTFLWAAGAVNASLPAVLLQVCWHGNIQPTFDLKLLFLGR